MKFINTIILILLPLILQSQVNWIVPDRVLTNVGDTIQVPVRVQNFDIIAYQFALRYNLDKLDLVGISVPDPTPIPMDNFDDEFFTDLTDTLFFPDCIKGNFGLCTEGEIRTVWNDVYNHSVPDNTTIFTLHFEVKQEDTLSNLISLAPDVLNNIAYWYTGLPFPLALSPRELNLYFTELPQQLSPVQEIDNPIRVYPNPTLDYIYVDSTEPVHVAVYNQLGQLTFSDKVYNMEQPIFIEQGTNVIKITSKDKTILKRVFKL